MSTKLRTLVLVAGAALAICAFAAPAAFGATEVRNAETEELCPAVQPAPVPGSNPTGFLFSSSHQYQSGGCTVQVSGAGVVASATSNGNWDWCNYQMTAHVGPDGWGYVSDTKFSGCTFYTTQQCAGDRIIAPAEYNPVLFGTKMFKYANGSTDLNVGFCANLPTFAGNYQGLTSYNLQDGYVEGEQLWTNQQTANPHWSWYNHTASGTGLDSSENLLITH